jgi:hypothetical protein
MGFYIRTFDTIVLKTCQHVCRVSGSASLPMSSGADHISDTLGFERWILANY